MFGRWQRTVEETTELNVIPVMNLFMVLIPFLLMGAAFYHVGVIPISTPTEAVAGEAQKNPSAIVTATMVITQTSIELTFSSNELTEAQTRALGASFVKTSKGWPLEKLRAHLTDVKKQYPKSTTLIVQPHPTIPYQELIGILDISREGTQTPEQIANEQKAPELFPVTVFSIYEPPPEAPAAPEPSPEAPKVTP